MVKPKLQLNENYDKVFEPRGTQIEALYALNQSREEGYTKALIVAATYINISYSIMFFHL